MNTTAAPSGYSTPPELAKRWRIKSERVLAMIRRGELRAFDVSEPGSSRPRFRISPDAVIEYENRHAPTAPSKPSRRRRDSTVTEYF